MTLPLSLIASTVASVIETAAATDALAAQFATGYLDAVTASLEQDGHRVMRADRREIFRDLAAIKVANGGEAVPEWLL